MMRAGFALRVFGKFPGSISEGLLGLGFRVTILQTQLKASQVWNVPATARVPNNGL